MCFFIFVKLLGFNNLIVNALVVICINPEIGPISTSAALMRLRWVHADDAVVGVFVVESTIEGMVTITVGFFLCKCILI